MYECDYGYLYREQPLAKQESIHVNARKVYKKGHDYAGNKKSLPGHLS